MPEPFVMIPALTLASTGAALSLILIGAGMVWMLVRAFKKKEVSRRIVFLFILVSVSAPLLFSVSFEMKITPIVQSVFESVDSLPAGSTVLISFDYDPAVEPEVGPMASAFLRHCLFKGHKVICMSLWATGQSLLTSTVNRIVSEEFPDKKNGVDWVNLGYKAGNEGVLNVIVTDLKKMFPTDVNSVAYDSIPIFDNIRSCADLDLILAVGSGKPGVKEWVLFVGDPAKVPLGAGVSAVSAPQLYPYYPGQLLGLLGGIKGAAEYESELKKRYTRFADTETPAIMMMGPQTVAHIVIIFFIIVGNVLYFRGRRREAA